jgi:hypothetical protein
VGGTDLSLSQFADKVLKSPVSLESLNYRSLSVTEAIIGSCAPFRKTVAYCGDRIRVPNLYWNFSLLNSGANCAPSLDQLFKNRDSNLSLLLNMYTFLAITPFVVSALFLAFISIVILRSGDWDQVRSPAYNISQ